ncbi:MAG: AAA family ATPase [Actinomycetales bacterium]|nr:AAA family ATPase [Actinomycetales bacterium]
MPIRWSGWQPSAAAAQVLGQSLGVGCENTAKWLVEHDAEPDRLARIDRTRRALHASRSTDTTATLTAYLHQLVAQVSRWRFRPGQLVVLDEASLAGTADLDRIAACVGEAGAKLLLVGDWAQLSAVDAGGAFALLARDCGPGVPELGAARRFIHAWERAASTRLRVGDITVIGEYAAHDRLREGDHDAMVEAAYTAWASDTHDGRASLLIAGDRATVHALNARARTDLVAAGRVELEGTPLRDGLTAGVGDRVVTRRNNRHLTLGAGWVKNGDTWIVTDRGADGSLTVRRPGGGPSVVLPGRVCRRARRTRLCDHGVPGSRGDRGSRPRHRHRRWAHPRGALRDAHPRPRRQHRVRVHRPGRRTPGRVRQRPAHRPDRPGIRARTRRRSELRPRSPRRRNRNRDVDPHPGRRVRDHRPSRPNQPLAPPARRRRPHHRAGTGGRGLTRIRRPVRGVAPRRSSRAPGARGPAAADRPCRRAYRRPRRRSAPPG